MFSNGFAARSAYGLPNAVVHIVADDNGGLGPRLWCSGGPAREGEPTHHNRLCPRCLVLLRDVRDDGDECSDIGWPWPIASVAGQAGKAEEGT